MALLTAQPRSATVRCEVDSEVIHFSTDNFYRLMETKPQAALHVTRTVVRRLQDQISGRTDRRGGGYSTVAVVPISPSADSRDLAARLARSLNEFGPGLYIHREMFGGATDGDLARAVATRAFELEERYKFLVFSADSASTQWTRLCFLHADIVLLVADTEIKAGDSRIESEILARLDSSLLGRTELVLQHPPRWRDHCNAASWLDSRKVADFHHIRRGSEADMDRLARLLSGRANSVVLSGGGSRGLAAIGILRALGEAGVPVDRIGGTSMGSLTAAQYVRGLDYKTMQELNYEHWVKGNPARDFTLPIMSLLRGRHMQQLVVDLCGEWQIEDMPLRYFWVSSDLGRAELVLHKNGRLWPAVRANGSFPVMGPPMFMDGRVLVDGGVLNKLPSDIIRREFGGRAPRRADTRHKILASSAEPRASGATGIIFAANHSSYFDLLAIAAALPRSLYFVAKAELRKPAILGFALRRIGTQFVERDAGASHGPVLRRMTATLNAGESILVLPEGTFFAKSGLRRFHMGAFTAAAMSGAPVVPLAIVGTRRLLPKGSRRPFPTPLTVALGSTLAGTGDAREQAQTLHDQTRASILSKTGEEDTSS